MSLAATSAGTRLRGSALVLVVNDEPELARRVVAALAAVGLRAVWAPDVSEADAALGVEAPDLVIVDELLGPSGIEAAPHALRARPRIVVRFDASEPLPTLPSPGGRGDFVTILAGADWFERLPSLALEVLEAVE